MSLVCAKCKKNDFSDVHIYGTGKDGVIAFRCNTCHKRGSLAITTVDA